MSLASKFTCSTVFLGIHGLGSFMVGGFGCPIYFGS